MTPEETTAYRSTNREQMRVSSLLELAGRGDHVLDVGTRDGYIATRLLARFERVTALDLHTPVIEGSRIFGVRGDVTALPFGDYQFDCVICAEVLEHLASPALERACNELRRVGRAVVVGVPYQQDLRVGRTTCISCGSPNPPWGHVNSFTESRLAELFSPARIRTSELVCPASVRTTNAFSTCLRDLAGNPWGTYSQQEPCVQCGAEINAPERVSVVSRAANRLADTLDRLCDRGSPQLRPLWIHVALG